MKQQHKKLTGNATINNAARHAGRLSIKNTLLQASQSGSVISCVLKLKRGG